MEDKFRKMTECIVCAVVTSIIVVAVVSSVVALAA